MKSKYLSEVFVLLGLALAFNHPAGAVPAQVLHDHVPAAVKSLQPEGRLPATNQLNLAIALPLRDPAGLTDLLRQIYDPASPNYRHYLTPEQFAERFGPVESDYQAVVAFADANGLRVTARHLNRVLLDVSGSVADVERALHVKLNTYRHPTENRTFYAPDAEPSLDLTVPILHISGLNNYSLPRPRLKSLELVNGHNAAPNAGSGPSGSFMGKDFRAAYAPGVTLDGTGQIVGLLQFDGYTASDITHYESTAGLPNVPLQNVLIDGATGSPSHSGGEVEVSLDIEMAISMATNLSKVIIYEAPDASPFVDLLSQMANDNLAKQLSCSWYVADGPAEPAADVIFQQMAAQGQSFFSASGDNDAFTGLIAFPGDTPYITLVGGTTLTTTGPGGSYVSETVWNWGIEYGRDGIGSGGGVSTQYGIPDWQKNISMAANQGSTTMRNTPDVALAADHIYVRADGYDYIEAGTSCSAPLWAGFMALVNQQAVAAGQPPVGFLNPLLDTIGSGANYSSAFHDIAAGNNTWSGSPTNFYAVTGYDLCTGWGTPAGQRLIDALANPEALNITPPTGFTSTGGFGGPFTITSLDLVLTNVGTNSLTWTLANTSAWLNISSSGGTLAPGGAAATVTVSLNTAASNLVAGTYSATVWFTNLNDNAGQSRLFTLNVISPPMITTQPTNQAVLEGATASFSVAATGGLPLAYQWQDNGANMADGGNISGSATTNLVISNVSSNDIGTYTVVVTNIAGSTISSNALLTITPSAPVIILQPSNQTAVVDGTAMFAVTAIGTMPLFYQWSFGGTNLQDATNAILTLANVQFTNAGIYTVVVTNSYGSATSSNAVLTVTTCDPAPSGLVAWWPGEGNANDIMGINNGSLIGGLGFAPEEVGQAFNFTNTSDGVFVPASPSLAVQSLTIEGWIYPTDISYQRPIVEYSTAGGPAMVQFWHSWSASGTTPGALYGLFRNPGGGGLLIASVAGLIPANQWSHVAMTFDYAAQTAVLYVDGVLVASNTPSGGTLVPQTAIPVNIGYRPNTSDELFAGTRFAGNLDEISIYNRALTASEIQAIYNAGSEGKCVPLVPPNIITQPANQMVAVGGMATFSVVAGGTQPIFYQWSFNGTNILGATNTLLTLTNVQFTTAGNYAVVVANAYGSVASSNALLTVGVAPTITTQPANSTNVVGTTATFNVVASGSTPLNYQWQKNGANINGATGTNFVIASVTTNDTGWYSVAVTNAFGSVLSSNATLTVLVPPVIILQPASQTVVVSNSATFNVVVAGTLPLSCQWSFNGTNIANATNTTLLLTNVQFNQAGNYAVQVTNAYGLITSSNAVLTVIPPPSCDPPPSGLISDWPAEGNANDIAGTNNGTISGTIAFTNGVVGKAFEFDGVSGYITVAASASLNVGAGNGFTIEGWVNYDPNVNSGPLVEWDSPSAIGVHFWPIHGLYANIIDISGTSHIFSSASGTTLTNVFQHVALTYDRSSGVANLYVNGAVVASQNLGPFTAQTTYPMNIGRRTVGIGSGSTYQGMIDELGIYNRALSSNEIAAIYNAGGSGKCPIPPFILAQPTNLTVSAGNSPTFRVTANGSQPLLYQWNFNGTNISGVTSNYLTLTNVQFSQAGAYSVMVANAGGSVVSSNAILTVLAQPTILSQPTNLTVIRSSNATFSVIASGSLPIKYLWNFNATNFIVATNNYVTLTNVQLYQAGNYTVLLTNAYGSILSSNAMLVVNPLFHFVWNQIPSPRFAAAPFAVTVQALNPTNGLAADFIDTVSFLSTNGMPVAPPVSGNFTQGVWTGAVTINQTFTNLVLEAMDSYGESGLANPINVVSLPSLVTASSAGSLYIFWPVNPSGFVLETTPGLSPANWVPVAAPPIQFGGQYFQPIQMSETNAFYRLRFTGQ